MPRQTKANTGKDEEVDQFRGIDTSKVFAKKDNDFDPVNHPKGYNSHPSGIQCIEITRHMNFNRGNAMKYIWRAGEKPDGDEIQDLKKAIWYLEDEIKRIEG